MGEQWRQSIQGVLGSAGVTVAEVRDVAEPKDVGRVVVTLDERASETVTALASALHPAVALFPPGDDDAFAVHLVARPWMVLACFTPERLAEVEAGAEPFEMDAALRAALDEAVATVAAATPLSRHPEDDRAVLVAAARTAHPEFAGRLADPRLADDLDGLTFQLETELGDQHARALRRDADELASQIIAAEHVSARETKDALRDVAWRHMRRIDPVCCAQKLAVEPIVTALAAIVKRV